MCTSLLEYPSYSDIEFQVRKKLKRIQNRCEENLKKILKDMKEEKLGKIFLIGKNWKEIWRKTERSFYFSHFVCCSSEKSRVRGITSFRFFLFWESYPSAEEKPP